MASAPNHWQKAEITLKGNPSIYSLKGRFEIFLSEEKKIRKCEIGTEVKGLFEEKVIMFVGETGSGKTTLINALANYFLGIEWKDDKRFKLIADREEKEDESQIQSKTKWISAYTFNQPKTLSYIATLVDTPGFGDTAGKERDDDLVKQIGDFFNSRKGIDHINAVALVVKASSARLTPTQKYIFDSVLHLFGEDIKDNIFLFITHAEPTQMDNEDAPVIQAVKKHKIPVQGYCISNNNVLFYQRENTGTGLRKSIDMHYEMMWGSMRQNLATFFEKLDRCTPRSLTLSKSVLEERKNLEIMAAGLPDLIKSSIVQMNILEEEEKVLKKHREEMESNRDFFYEVNQETIEQTPLDGNKQATVCNVCKRTCHFPCTKDVFVKVLGLRMCAAMMFLPEFRGCAVCPKNCSVGSHSFGPIKYDRTVKRVRKTKQDMKDRYETAKKNINDSEVYVKICQKMQIEAEEEIKECVKKLRKCLERLDEIALKSDPYAFANQLKLLKEKETRNIEPGWGDRVKKLNEILQDELQNIQPQEGTTEHPVVEWEDSTLNATGNTVPSLVSAFARIFLHHYKK